MSGAIRCLEMFGLSSIGSTGELREVRILEFMFMATNVLFYTYEIQTKLISFCCKEKLRFSFF